MFLVAVGLLALFAASTGVVDATAAGYPDKAVTLVVPYPAGGRTDLTGRVLAQYLKDALGQPVVVVNKAGAGGVLGAKEVANAKADGYTLGVFSTGAVSAQYTVPTPVNLKEYHLISIVNVDPAAMAVSATAPWKTAREFAEHAKKNPDTLKVGMIPGSSSQVFAASFAKAAGIKVVYVPFKGDADGATALAGGHLEGHFAVPVSYKALAEGGKIRVLGVAAEKREGIYKDFPTFKEQGIDLTIASFHGIFAPKGTPKEVQAVLDQAIAKTFKNQEFIETMNKAYMAPVYMNQEKGSQFLTKQDELYRKIIEELGLMVSKPQ
jgi:tripartite-type tricarboxylate transporter receptor subunit TctC